MEVNMDILELRALEKKIADLTAEKEDLLATRKQVVIFHKHFNGTVKLNPGQRAERDIRITGIRATKRINPRFGEMSAHSEYFELDIDLAEAISRGWLMIDLMENTTKTTKDYENLSEVVKDIHEEEAQKVHEELLKAQLRTSEAEHYSATVDDKCQKQILELKEVHKSQLNNFEQAYIKKHEKEAEDYKINLEYEKDKYHTLQQEFEDFKADKKRLTLEQQIVELKAALDKALNPPKRSFWSKWF